MRTFLDNNINYSKSFIIYGNTNDAFWCPDLMPRDLEHYLVKLLKSRGYEHIIFYGEAGTKGAYCLDAQSARFFFSANSGIPVLPPIGDDLESSDSTDTPAPAVQSNPSQDSNATGSQVSDALAEFFDDDPMDDYTPGDLSRGSSAEVSQPEEQPEESQSRSHMVRYAYRSMTLNEFMQIVHPLMLEKDSRMAVVFYNMLTTNFGDSNLRDDILNIWENNTENNVCIMIVPETHDNDEALLNALGSFRMESKFMQKVSEHCTVPNPLNCIRIGQPDTDEIRNLLRFLSIVGTDKHKRIKIDYNRIDKIAQRVVYASGIYSKNNPHQRKEYMRDINCRIAFYVDRKAAEQSKSVIEFALEDVDKVWEIESDEGKALKELSKEGWEDAYKKVTAAVAKAKKERAKFEESQQDNVSKSPKGDWGIERVGSENSNGDEFRPKIPNFLLLGPPGVGKTTIARLIGRILHEAGILKIGRTVEVTKEQLTSSYIAGVPKATKAKINEAEEGVLFIDECHELGYKDGGANNDGTGHEVISTLNNAMTNPNHHFCVIAAGYESKMEPLFALDPGFKSRFDYIIRLDSYEPEMLASILKQRIQECNYILHDSLTSVSRIADTEFVPIDCMVERVYAERDREQFANARDIIRIADSAMGACEGNVVTKECFYGTYDGKIDENWFEPNDIAASLDYVLNELEENFVGMDKVKEKIKEIGLKLKEYAKRNIPVDKMELRPIIIVGNPGTGKSTVAKLLPKLYYHYQIIGSSQPIIVHASELADTYVGGSQTKILEYIKKAQDTKGFLFVDEAHELTNPNFDGKGAFKAFMAPLTDTERPFMACFAVYPHLLNEFLKLDAGGKRRFEIIEIEDYNGDELYEILQRNIKKRGYTVTPDAENLLKQVMNRQYVTRDEQTGNAGNVIKILDDIDAMRRKRCAAAGIPFGSEESLVILPEDIPLTLREGMRVEEPKNAKERLDDILKDFENEFVGMKNVKKELRDIALSIQEYIERGESIENIPLRSIVLVGNPGTGKSSLMNVLPRIYAHFGILHDSEPIIVSASQLASRYQGGSQEIIREHIAKAQKRKAMLCVDEAHELMNEHFDGAGAFKTFMSPLTDKKNPFLACFAVYPDKLNAFLNMDWGADRRMRVIKLEDYTGEELFEIFKRMLGSQKLSAEPETEKLIKQYLNNVHKLANETTGNAGHVERLIADMDSLRRARCDANGISFGSKESRIFKPEDIPENIRNNLSLEDGSKLERLLKLKERIKNERVGMKNIKDILVKKADSLIFQEKFPNLHPANVEPGHYFFEGAPGTGKTTGTQFVARYLYELGLVQSPEPIFTSATDLIGMYLGHTGNKTKNLLLSSRGKVLMIDEAYALADTSASGGDSYKRDAVNEIIGLLDDENFRKNTCVIFCGYPHEMDMLLKTNTGFQDRVTEVEFEDFTVEQSLEILKSMLTESKININESAYTKCAEQFEHLVSLDNYGNGRSVRRYKNMLINALEQRCLEHIDEYESNDPRASEIQPEDIPELEEVMKILNLS